MSLILILRVTDGISVGFVIYRLAGSKWISRLLFIGGPVLKLLGDDFAKLRNKNKDCNEEKGTQNAKGMEQDQAEVRREPVAGDSDRQHRSHRGSEADRSSISRTGTSSIRREREAQSTRDVNLLTTTRTTVVVLRKENYDTK